MTVGEEEASAVAEIQGLEGAFSFAELLLQRIWLRGDFDCTRVTTMDGQAVRIFYPGKWNRQGGPDFLDARLGIGGQKVSGDVELHLRAGDWNAHGHADDPRYRNVIVHVVLFPPKEAFSRGSNGKIIPTVALLTLLYRSLEEYAEEDAVERLADHPLARAHESLQVLPAEDRARVLIELAHLRWEAKLKSSAQRIARLGWDEACHQTALEVLGYRFNRGPMLALAAEFPLENWPNAGEHENIEKIRIRYGPRWNRQAVRPANHPIRRIQQYACWTRAVPRWPDQLSAFSEKFAAVPSLPTPTDTAHFRRANKMSELWSVMRKALCGDAVSGSRFRTLVCDAFLPLMAAERPALASTVEQFWFHANEGDIPDNIALILSAIELTPRKRQPLCHGLAQGLLSWCWREEDKARSAACPQGRGT